MPLYTFGLRADDAKIRDNEGIALASADVAYRYACDVVSELMDRREGKTRHWCLDLYEEGTKISQIPFVALDQTLDDVSAEFRSQIEYTSQQIRAIKDMLLALKAARQELHALTARARGKPYLAAIEGEKVIRDGT
jgi:hypothetical protein